MICGFAPGLAGRAGTDHGSRLAAASDAAAVARTNREAATRYRAKAALLG